MKIQVKESFYNSTTWAYTDKTYMQLRYYELNLKLKAVSLKQTISINTSGNILTYLTKNGKYLSYALEKGSYMMVYEKKNEKYEFATKFWNFTSNPSDIYIS
jgi:hypothetical protein